VLDRVMVVLCFPNLEIEVAVRGLLLVEAMQLTGTTLHFTDTCI
jgi:hypothetical protein